MALSEGPPKVRLNFSVNGEPVEPPPSSINDLAQELIQTALKAVTIGTDLDRQMQALRLKLVEAQAEILDLRYKIDTLESAGERLRAERDELLAITTKQDKIIADCTEPARNRPRKRGK